MTLHATELRDLLEAHRSDISEILLRYRASNPRLFGSVARGTSASASDLDILVDLDPDGGNALLRVAGIGEELSEAPQLLCREHARYQATSRR